MPISSAEAGVVWSQVSVWIPVAVTCEELGGEFAGMDLYCWRGDVQCEVDGRCCLPCPENGLLCREDFDLGTCSNYGGQWVANATCDSDPCPVGPDCNTNGRDSCEIQDGSAIDCNDNSIPDECELDPDCNVNGIPDQCDISEGNSSDCDLNGQPDECEPDCDIDGLPDACELIAIEMVFRTIAKHLRTVMGMVPTNAFVA